MPPVLQSIVDKWFLFEPALFTILLSHRVVENNNMVVLFRVGQRRVEYNPVLLGAMDDKSVEELLRYEMIRILLGHPYMRQPEKPIMSIVTMASNCVIRDSYPRAKLLYCPSVGVGRGLCFEEYYKLIKDDSEASPITESSQSDGNTSEQKTQEQQEKQEEQEEQEEQEQNAQDKSDSDSNPQSGDDADADEGSNDNSDDGSRQNAEDDAEEGSAPSNEDEAMPRSNSNGDGRSPSQRRAEALAQQSELWEDDPMTCSEISEVIKNIIDPKMWGSIPGNMIETIKSSLVVKIDYRRILSMFRASVLSSQRHLTRMLPSRRYGFDFMGSKRDMKSSLLVAVDTSSSVSTPQVELALAAINRTFKYGVESIDVVQFDRRVYENTLLSIHKAQHMIMIRGRGGTDFQPAIDYYCAAKKYDGLMIITDGFAYPPPVLPPAFRGHILWMLYNDSAYKSADRYTLSSGLEWIGKYPRSRYLILPPATV